MNCPKCNWDLKYNEKDEFAQWKCSRNSCDWLATDKYMRGLTDKDVARIKKEVEDTIRFRQKQQADREVAVIEAARKAVEDEKTVHDIAREHKGMASIMDFAKEKK